jgi:hypothetical protein
LGYGLGTTTNFHFFFVSVLSYDSVDHFSFAKIPIPTKVKDNQ